MKANFYRVFIGLMFCSELLGCFHRVAFEKPADFHEAGILKRLQRQVDERKQVVTKWKVTSYGLNRLMGSADIQAIAKAPDKLFLEVQSFFSQPMFVLAANGELLTWLDLREPSMPQFGKEAVSAKRIVDIFGVPLTPSEVIDLALGAPPLHDAKITNLDFKPYDNEYVVAFEKNNGRTISCAFREEDDTISSCNVYKGNGDLIYDVQFQDYRRVDGVLMAHRWVLRVGLSQSEQRLKLVALEMQVNSDSFEDETFVLEAP